VTEEYELKIFSNPAVISENPARSCRETTL
jgi:hypothetical protein